VFPWGPRPRNLWGYPQRGHSLQNCVPNDSHVLSLKVL
jgi:hypothetical protein